MITLCLLVMKILLDTHIDLWAISDDPKLSQRELIAQAKAEGDGSNI
jgi:PIN domain nuclease of toxin-antitoxin system